VLGAVGGGLAGSALGGGTLGTVLGAGGGALLGRHLDKRHDAAQNRRNGC
jgi:outer membrane lipoprotein SlyB